MEINNSSSACDNYLHKNVQTVKLMLSLATEILLLCLKTTTKNQNRNNPHIIFNILSPIQQDTVVQVKNAIHQRSDHQH